MPPLHQTIAAHEDIVEERVGGAVDLVDEPVELHADSVVDFFRRDGDADGADELEFDLAGEAGSGVECWWC